MTVTVFVVMIMLVISDRICFCHDKDYWHSCLSGLARFWGFFVVGVVVWGFACGWGWGLGVTVFWGLGFKVEGLGGV